MTAFINTVSFQAGRRARLMLASGVARRARERKRERVGERVGPLLSQGCLETKEKSDVFGGRRGEGGAGVM